MIPAIVIITLSFLWLLRETDWLTIRLPYGKALQSNSTGIEGVSHSLPLPVLSLPTRPQPLLLAMPIIHFKPSEFIPLDMPEFSGKINIVCVRE